MQEYAKIKKKLWIRLRKTRLLSLPRKEITYIIFSRLDDNPSVNESNLETTITEKTTKYSGASISNFVKLLFIVLDYFLLMINEYILLKHKKPWLFHWHYYFFTNSQILSNYCWMVFLNNKSLYFQANKFFINH